MRLTLKGGDPLRVGPAVVTPEQATALDALVERRMRREPVSRVALQAASTSRRASITGLSIPASVSLLRAAVQALTRVRSVMGTV